MTTKQLVIRSSLTVALPFVLIWAVFEVLFREMRAAFRYAWLEIKANIASYRDLMKREDY